MSHARDRQTAGDDPSNRGSDPERESGGGAGAPPAESASESASESAAESPVEAPAPPVRRRRRRAPRPADAPTSTPSTPVPSTPVPSTQSPSSGTEVAAGAADRTQAEAPPPGAAPWPADQLIVVAVRGMVLFPGVVLPVVVGRERSVRAVKAALQAEQPIGLLLQRTPEDEDPPADELYPFGTLAEILRYVTAPDGTHHVIVQGRERFRVLGFVQTEPYLIARVERLPAAPQEEHEKRIEARTLHLRQRALEALRLLPEHPEELDTAIQNQSSASGLADMVATFMEIPAHEKQELLETVDLERRMDAVTRKLDHLVAVLSLTRELRNRTKGSMEKAQREYFLREQLKQIQSELGEEQNPELAGLAQKLEAAKLPEEVQKESQREFARLQRMPEQAAEYGVIRTYLETLAELPWHTSTVDAIDLKRARKILDQDHFGLEKVKARILEFLAVRKLNPQGKSPILCLVGPPGVGKTSLGQSIARAMGREFVRLSLGGVHDESELRGHRRTYVGAMPGNVITGIKRAGSNNPVFMLDEMDKLSRGFHGDPASALLEVLDPEQNRTFRDHYLGVPFDLSRVMFVATANVLDSIPGPLRDRCEVIELSGYTEEEKLEIARRYLLARQIEANGLSPKNFAIDEQALVEVARYYTREAGCRNLEQRIGALARHAATQIASGQRRRLTIRKADVARILGPRKFESEVKLRTSVPGVATGLAWTPAGGDMLFIEATRMPGKGELLVTGQLGEVMKESVRAALSLVKSRLEELAIPREVFERCDLHLHFPAGAIPKDGPSAGVTVFTALVSLLTGRRVRADVAMTGEISLRGLVLPVGGIKEKLLAAYRAGVDTVLIPARNGVDLHELPAEVRKGLDVVLLEDVAQALDHALEPRPVRGFKALC
jgi:ATP-dependent Lon protease